MQVAMITRNYLKGVRTTLARGVVGIVGSLLILCSQMAFARDTGEIVANKRLSDVSECRAGTQGMMGIITAELTMTFQIQSMVFEFQDIESASDFNRALFKGAPLEGVHGIFREDKQVVHFHFDGSRSAIELCQEVRGKLISGFNVNH